MAFIGVFFFLYIDSDLLLYVHVSCQNARAYGIDDRTAEWSCITAFNVSSGYLSIY